MKKNLLRFFLSLIGLSALLTWLWFYGLPFISTTSLQLAYAGLFRAPAIAVFRLLGISKSGMMIVLEHYTNLVPYIALCLALPGVPWVRRLTRLGYGLGIQVVVHFLLLVIVSKVYTVHALSPTAYKYIFPLLTINDALPLVLWFLFFSEEIILLFRRQKTA